MTPALAYTAPEGLHTFRVIIDCVNDERRTGQEQNGENEICDVFIHQKKAST